MGINEMAVVVLVIHLQAMRIYLFVYLNSCLYPHHFEKLREAIFLSALNLNKNLYLSLCYLSPY
ncbi:MAG: hypothetical protein AB2693_26350 [Candidatus Thiodiazotropha sp.]